MLEWLKQLPDFAWGFTGTVIAALIVLFSGWLQQRISRASTVSGYRQKWIQDIRSAFAEYIFELDKLADAAAKTEKPDQIYGMRPSIAEDTSTLRSKRNLLKLFTNPNEAEHRKLLIEAIALEKYLTDTARAELKLNQYEEQKAALTRWFQNILKEEWDRVKLGEIRWSLRRKWRCITRHCS